MIVSFAQAKKALSYDPETGKFTRLERKNQQSTCGWLDRKGYVRIGISGGHAAAHQLAWLMVYGEWPELQIDHVNGDKADNRIVNLRLATNGQNQANCPVQRNNSSGHKGVSYHSGAKRFYAFISKDGCRVGLGSYKTLDEAVAVRRKAFEELHGHFARHA